ncbi:MAG: hypothetical protein ACYCVN_12315 [Acidimicrobiales bacterium]
MDRLEDFAGDGRMFVGELCIDVSVSRGVASITFTRDGYECAWPVRLRFAGDKNCEVDCRKKTP